MKIVFDINVFVSQIINLRIFDSSIHEAMPRDNRIIKLTNHQIAKSSNYPNSKLHLSQFHRIHISPLSF